MKKITIVVAISLLLGVGAMTYPHTKKQVVQEEDVVEVLPEKPLKTVANYYPVAKDSRWVYSDAYNPESTLCVTVDFIKDKTYQMRYAYNDFSLVKVLLGEETLYEVASVEDAFMKTDYTLLRQYKDAFIKLPIQKGTTWTLQNGATRTIVATDKLLNTPMKVYEVIEVRTVHDTYEEVHYYAEKVGLVGYTYESDTQKRALRLEQYETNAPHKQAVTIFYPNKEEQRLEPVAQVVSIMTNEEPKHFLTDLLSMTPDVAMLQPLPDDAEILAIYRREEEGGITVDLSKGYEAYRVEDRTLAVDSVVQSIGQYYDVDYVTLTINGVVYKEGIAVRR